MKYKDELIRSMEWLSEKDDTVFLGQSVLYSGNAIYNTLNTLPSEKMIELPVFEEVQMGMSTGLALDGYVPISCFPRFDFLMRCMDALMNHLDKVKYMTENIFQPKVLTLLGGITLVRHPQFFPKRPTVHKNEKMVGTKNHFRCLQPLGRNPPVVCITTA